MVQDSQIDIKSLHPLEIRVLVGCEPGDPISAEKLKSRLDFNIGQCNQALSWLHAKGLITESTRNVETVFEMTELGRSYAEQGSPGHRLLELLRCGVDILRLPLAGEDDPEEGRILELPPSDRPRGPRVRFIRIEREKKRKEGDNET